MPNPYATDEPATLLWAEQANYAAIHIGGIAYGVHISVFFMTIYYLLKMRTKHFKKKLLFIFVLFALGTINLCFNMHSGEQTWIDNRNYPGGPLAYFVEQTASPMLTAGNAESIVISLLADGLLIYRCYVLYRLWWLLVIPVLVWLATFACGILFTLQASHPGSSLFTRNTLDFSIPYFALSMALTMLLTTLLISRLLYMRYQLKKALGNDYTRLYTTVAVMLFESALPYGLVSLVFIVLYGIGNTAATLFIPLLAQVECISTMVIILRVARGKAWTNETVSGDKLTSLRFQKTQQKTMDSALDGDTPRETSMVMFIPGEPDGTGRTRVENTTFGAEEV